MKDVQIVGNRAFSDAAITSKLATRPPHGILRRMERFDPVALALDERRIVAFYRDRGYFSAHVRDVAVSNEDDSRVRVRISVDEGLPTPMTAVTIAGLPPGQEDLAARTRLRAGDIFRYDAYLKAKDELKQGLLLRGYAHVEVDGDVRIDRDARWADVQLTLTPGPLVFFGQAHVDGATHLPKRSLNARIAWKPGERFDPVKLEQTRSELAQLGAYRIVALDYARADRPEVSDVTIRLADTERHELRLGGGLAVDRTRFELRGLAGFAIRSRDDPLLLLRLETRPGYALVNGHPADSGFGGSAIVSVEKLDLLDLPRLAGVAEAAYTLDIYEAFQIRGPRGRVALSRPLFNQRIALAGTARFAQEQGIFDDSTLPERFQLSPSARIMALGQSITLDGRDNPLDASRGAYLRFDVEEGLADSDVFLRFIPDVRVYRAFSPRVVTALRARVALLSSGGHDVGIPERFFGGGANGHRGFAYRRLSPMIPTDDGRLIAIGGEAALESSAELRCDIARVVGHWLGAVAFVDAGDVTPRIADLDVTGLHWAAGLGLRYDTIVGPLRLDVGARLNRVETAAAGKPANPDPGNRFAIHLSLGEAF